VPGRPESEALVRRALEPLKRHGWRVRHSLDWLGPGDLDHVVRAPTGIGFVIETKTLRFNGEHELRTIRAARWLAGQRRRYPCGVRPVLCVTRGRRVEHSDDWLLIVSLDRLIHVLETTAEVDRVGRPTRHPRALEASIRTELASRRLGEGR
jgi:Nuclease-related domain